MERTDILELMSTLKLLGMRAAYDEVMATQASPRAAAQVRHIASCIGFSMPNSVTVKVHVRRNAASVLGGHAAVNWFTGPAKRAASIAPSPEDEPRGP